jgi:excisionase family DNA binding protein
MVSQEKEEDDVKYGVKEAAKMLGIKVRTLREWIRVGKIKAEKDTNDWYWLIPESEVQRIVVQRVKSENADKN